MRVGSTLLVAVLLLSPLTIKSLAQEKDAVADDIKKLQGRWQVIKFDDGSGPGPADEIKEMKFEFKGDNVIQRLGDNARPPAKVVIDPAKKPKWMDIDAGGPQFTSKGIYKLEGDELSLCFISGERGGKAPPRPTEFKANDKAPYSFLLLKRITN
jgi:uncharacterized protein (TIGR03067 family)